MKRWLARILFCLVLGAVMTVSLAWMFVLWPTPTPQRTSPLAFYDVGQRSADATTSRFNTNIERRRGFFRAQQDWAPPPQRSAADNESRHSLPDWSVFRDGGEPLARFGESAEIFFEGAGGWPFLCLKYECAYDLYWRGDLKTRELVDRFVYQSGMIEVPFRLGDRNEKRFLPWRPIWPGFIADAAVFGALWFALLFGFGATRAARRALRKHRGLCPICAYDLRGDLDAGCPECG